MFNRNLAGPNRWAQSAKLVAGDLSQGANFGIAVAISGSTIVVGASGDSRLGQNAGGAYVFDRLQDVNLWTETAKLVPNDLAAGDLFGYRGAVAISANTIAIGALGADQSGQDAGAVYLFKRNESQPGIWQQATMLVARDAVELGRYGSSVAIHNEDVAVAAETDTLTGKDAGLGYVALGTTVVVDIVPGNPNNPINVLKKKGVVKVAVLSTTSPLFDATMIDVTMTTFGKTGTEKFEKHGTLHIQDVDNDGTADAFLHFDVSSSGLLCSDTMAIIQGKTLIGADFMGMDSIQTVGKCKKVSDLLTSKILPSGDFTAGSPTPSVYQITVENLGPATAKSVSVSDPLPSDISLAAAPTTTLGTCTGGTGDTSFSCSLGDIPSGTTVTITASVLLDASASGNKTNTATVDSSTDPNAPHMPETTNMVAVEADLSITKVVSGDFKAGETATYLITVDNLGPSDAANVHVTDTIPGTLTIDTVTPSQGSCSGDPMVDCSLGIIAAGGNATVTVVVDISPDATGTINNTADVTSDTTDPVSANDSDTDSTSVAVLADLTITKSADVSSAVAGLDSIVYTITVTNNGPATATSVTVADTLPAGVSGATTIGCDEDDGGVPTCTLTSGASIDVGANAQYTITVAVDANATTPSTITNSATASSPDDSETGNNTATADVNVVAQADLGITKSDTGFDPVVTNAPLVYTITVTNSGPSDATNVVVTDTLPAGLMSPVTAGCLNDTAGAASCMLGTIAAGAMTQYTITGLAPATPGSISNSATVASDATDNTPGNDIATEGTLVINP